MSGLRAWFSRLGGLFGKERRDGELAAELEIHLEMHVEEYVRAGMSPEEARRRALVELGGIEQTKEIYRERRGLPWLETLLQDVRFGARMLRKNPGFTTVAIVTLALGIGVNVAIFSVVDATLLDPIPLPQPDRIVSVFEKWPSFPYGPFSYPNFLDLQRDSSSFSGLAAWRVESFSLTGLGEPEQLHGKMVSGNFFSLLGVRPILGRTFRAEEDQLGAGPVAVLSEGLWKRRFGSIPDILGKSIALDGKDYTIIGVVPSSFHLLRFQDSFFDDIFVPVGQWDNRLLRDRRFSLGLRTVGRLAVGVTLSQARAEMDQIAHKIVSAYPDQASGMGISAIPFKEDLVGRTQPALLLLWGAVGLVLLIACANVANLLLARSSARKKEFAVRSAMGASRSRLVRQLMAESILLASAGGAFGIALAMWSLPLVLRIFPSALPAIVRVEMNLTVLAVAVGVSFVTGITFGLAPALRISAVNLQGTLKEGGRGSTAERHGAQSAFVVAEVGLSLILLIAAGLLIRSFAKVWAVNPGFEPNHILTLGITFSPVNTSSPEKARAKLRELTGRLAALPGVQSVSVNLGDLPLEGDSEVPFWPSEKPKPLESSEMPLALSYSVGPDYFKAMQIPILRGRVFTPQDDPSAPAVAVIDEDLATSIFPGEEVVGKTLNIGTDPKPIEILGVVGHVKHWGLDADAKAPVHYQVYFSYIQLSGPLLPIAVSNASVVVRSNASPETLVGPIRKEIGSFDGSAVVYNVRPMDQLLASSLAERRFSMALLGIFAGIALLLAVIGVYGVVSYLVGRRTHEIGIRIALGAQQRDILCIVLGEGGKMALVGIVIGLAASLVVTRFMATMLFGVSATDPLTFVVVAFILLSVTLLACWIPARRAMRVDPMVALRYE
jgi:predicted permease